MTDRDHAPVRRGAITAAGLGLGAGLPAGLMAAARAEHPRSRGGAIVLSCRGR
jgi:hypothetical protein